MSEVIVRKIQKGKWEDYCKGIKSKSRIKRFLEEWKPNASADAITNCLKTTGNELSIWIVDEANLDDALLAMATGSEMNDLGTINYVTFTLEEFRKNRLSFKQSSNDANTAVQSLKDNHYDIENLDYKQLGIIQKMIVHKIITNQSGRKTRGELFPIIEKAIDENKIDFLALSDSYLRKLKAKYPNKGIPDPMIQG